MYIFTLFQVVLLCMELAPMDLMWMGDLLSKCMLLEDDDGYVRSNIRTSTILCTFFVYNLVNLSFVCCNYINTL